MFDATRFAIARASLARFRVLHFSVQTNHIHLVVEADAGSTLRGGLQGLAIRVAKAVNRTLGRHGRVWGDRYHVRLLRTPREVRNCLAYVLNNWRKHLPAMRGIDPCSSAAWFDGWREGVSSPSGVSPLAKARTWLARMGWRRHGVLSRRDGPRLATR